MNNNADDNRVAPGIGTSRRTFLWMSVSASAAVLGGSLLAGCGGSDDDTADGTEPGGSTAPGTSATSGADTTLIVAGAPGVSDTFNVLNIDNIYDGFILAHVYDSLARIVDGQLVNQVAERFEPNADATTWTITIRQGVAFHTGAQVTAADVVYGLQSLCDPAKSPLAVLHSDIDAANIRAVDERTVEVPLTRPRADLVESVLSVVGMVIPDGTTDYAAAPGTGPYVLESYNTQGAVLVANPDYWGGAPKIERIEMQRVADAQARLNALKSGQIGYALGIEPTAAVSEAANNNVQIIRGDLSSASIMEFVMNPSVAPFDDPEVRRAFRLACDREALVATALLGQGEVAGDRPGRGLPGYPESIPAPEFDPDTARSILAAAGVDQITLRASEIYQGLVAGSQLFAQQLGSVGVNVSIDEVPQDAFFADMELVASAPLQSYAPGNLPAQAQLAAFTGSHAYLKLGNPADPTYDAELEAVQGIVDDADRATAFEALQKRYIEEGGHIMWGYAYKLDAAVPGLTGLHASQYGASVATASLG